MYSLHDNDCDGYGMFLQSGKRNQLQYVYSFKQASEDCELLYKMFLILWFMVFQIFAYSMLGTEIMSAVKINKNTIVRIMKSRKLLSRVFLQLRPSMRSVGTNVPLKIES